MIRTGLDGWHGMASGVTALGTLEKPESDGVRGAGVVQDPSQREEAEFF